MRQLLHYGKLWRLGLIAVPILAACQGTKPAKLSESEVWSTKADSVLGPGTPSERLNVPAIEAETAAALREPALEILRQASESTNPLLRAHAIEALAEAPSALSPILARAIHDENRGVRFAAIMTAGRLHQVELLDEITHLLDDPSLSVRAAAIYALRFNRAAGRGSAPALAAGQETDPTPLAEMLLGDDPEVKANAALVLGELGDPSALPMLRDAVRRGARSGGPARVSVARLKIVDLQIAEAMVKLGAESELEVIRAALFAPSEQAELAALACQMCGRLRDEAYVSAIRDMAYRPGRDREPVEVRLAAMQALAQIDPTRASASLPLEFVASPEYALRAQAAVTLGWIGDPDTIPELATMLHDTNPLVQVAAAGAILRLTRPALAAGTGTEAPIDTNDADR